MRLVALLPVLAASLIPAAALADDCADRLAALIAVPTLDGQPYEALSTGAVGGMPTVTRQQFQSERHYLVTTLEPEGMPDTLYYEGGTYAADGAGGWSLLYEVDADDMQRQFAETRTAQAANILSATCGEEVRDGMAFDLVAGQVAPTPPYDSPLDLRYLIDRGTGLAAHLDYAYLMQGMETTVSFAFRPVPDMSLPQP